MEDEEGEDDGGLKRGNGRKRNRRKGKNRKRKRRQRQRECIREDDGKVMGNYWIEMDGSGR